MHFVLQPHPELSLCYLAVLPILYWFIRHIKTKRAFLYGLVFIYAFSMGPIEVAGISSSTILGIILEGATFLLFVGTFLLTFKKSFKLPAIWAVIGFILISILSYLLNDLYLIQLLLFFRQYLFVFIIFYIFYNTSFSSHEKEILDRLIIYLFVAQIFAGIIKVLLLGTVAEEFIGTVAYRGGSLTTMIALIGSAYCIVGHLITSKKKYLIGVLGFVVFSITGGKRGTIVYLPLIYIVGMYFYHRKFSHKTVRLFRKLLVALFAVCVMLYASARVIPSLNPQHEIGGSFNLEYIIDYSIAYANADANQVNSIGRAEAPTYTLGLLSNSGVLHFLLGNGAGSLTKSSFNNIQGGDFLDVLGVKYGLGYGARASLIQMLLQVGVLGTVFYLLFIIYFLKRLLRIEVKTLGIPDKILVLYAILLFFIILLDFFTYSPTLTGFNALSISYMWFIVRALKTAKSKKKLITT